MTLEIDEIRAFIAYKNITKKEISKGINRAYNSVCLVLRGKRKSNRILKEILEFVVKV